MDNEEYVDEPQEEVVEDSQEVLEESSSGYIDDPDEYVRRTGKPRETFRSKGEYNEFGQLKEELKAVREELKNWKTTAQMTASMYTTVDQKAYERAYQDVQAKIADAYAMGDQNTAVAAQQELQQLQYADASKKQAAQQQQLRQIEQDFVERNKDWYNDNNPDLQRKAHFLVDKYKMTPNITADQIVRMVETEIREFHLNKKPSNSTPNISRTASGGNKIAQEATSKLPASKKAAFKEQQAVMYSLGVKNYTEADYIAYLKQYGEL